MLDKKIISQFVEQPEDQIETLYQNFLSFAPYLKTIFKQDKSLTLDEAFVLYLVSNIYKIKHVAEIGVRYGISTRFWLNTLSDCKVSGYDLKKLYNKRIKSPIKSPNFSFIEGNVAKTWQNNNDIDLMFYDAHPYKITYDLAIMTKDKVQIHCFHDVGNKCFKRESCKIPREKRVEFDIAGHWERHIMAEVFTPNILDNIFVIDKDWRSLIIDDRYGVGVVIHNSIVGDKHEL